MYKKTVTYEDYDGLERTETFYFNMSKAELLELEFTPNGSFSNIIQRIINEKDMSRLIGLFKMILDKSYGVKSDDGRRFVKNKDVLDAFKESPAYSDIYMEFVTDTDAAIDFVNGIMPSDIVKEMEKQESKQNIVPVSIE